MTFGLVVAAAGRGDQFSRLGTVRRSLLPLPPSFMPSCLAASRCGRESLAYVSIFSVAQVATAHAWILPCWSRRSGFRAALLFLCSWLFAPLAWLCRLVNGRTALSSSGQRAPAPAQRHSPYFGRMAARCADCPGFCVPLGGFAPITGVYGVNVSCLVVCMVGSAGRRGVLTIKPVAVVFALIGMSLVARTYAWSQPLAPR